MRYSIRKMTATDVEEVIVFWRSAGFSRIPSQRRLIRFLAIGFGMIVRLGHKVVGATLYAVCGPSEGYLEFFGVAQSQRRRGVGCRLYRAVLSDLHTQGIRRLLFLVGNDNAIAAQFWNAVGPRPIRSVRPYFKKFSGRDL